MILVSLISVFFVTGLLSMYRASVEYYHVANFYPGLYVGILNIFTLAIGLLSAVSLLKGKHFSLSIIGIIFVLASGFVAPLIFLITGYMWQNGLLLGSPMIFLSLVALILASLGHRKPSE